jgi:TolA-binding protein
VTRDECRSDLLIRARRGQLSGDGSVALRAHLDSCASCRASERIFADLDRSGMVDPSDGARMERLSAVARRWARGRRRPRATRWIARSRRALAAAASLVLVGGSASAAVWWWRHPVPAPAPEQRALAAVTRPPTPAAHRARVATPPAEAAAVATAPLEAPAIVGRPHDDRRGHRPRAAAAGAVDAAALLRSASDARRIGDGDRAVHLYRKLQAQFPGSPEAMLSSIPLGGLLLERGAARAALAEFERYLAKAGDGALVPEALYGRGRALHRLGDRRQERQTWERLLAEFPDSAYAAHGQRRLDEAR